MLLPAVVGVSPTTSGLLLLLTHQVGLDKPIKLPIHNRPNITHLIIRPVVLDHLIGVKHIAPYLRPPLYLLLTTVGCILQRIALLQLYLIQLTLKHLHSPLPVPELTSILLTYHHNPRRHVRKLHLSLHLIHILPTRTTTARC